MALRFHKIEVDKSLPISEETQKGIKLEKAMLKHVWKMYEAFQLVEMLPISQSNPWNSAVQYRGLILRVKKLIDDLANSERGKIHFSGETK